VESEPAILSIPESAEVTHADVLWAASDPGSMWREAQIIGPDGKRRPIKAATDMTLDNGAAQASSDIASLVNELGSGEWRVSAVSRAGGENAWGGWALVVAYRDLSAPSDGVVVVYRGTLRVGVGQDDSFALDPPLTRATRLGVVRWGARPDEGGDGLWVATSARDSGLVWPAGARVTEDAQAPMDSSAGGVSVVALRDLEFPQDQALGRTRLSFRVDATSETGQSPYAVGAVTLLAHTSDQSR
jgi:hypothetical protein